MERLSKVDNDGRRCGTVLAIGVAKKKKREAVSPFPSKELGAIEKGKRDLVFRG